MSDAAAKAPGLVSSYEAWLREQVLEQLLPKESLLELLDEIRADDAFWTQLKPQYERAWKNAEGRLRAETKPLKTMFTDKAAEEFLESLERMDPDPEIVRTFLRSPANEAMLGSILYTGISEFIKKVDIIGRVINRLPVIGPIRRKVMSIFQEEIEDRLEGQIKSFLGGFSGLAVEKMIQFVLSEENRARFSKSRRRVGEHLLERPINSLLPEAKALEQARKKIWKSLRVAALKDEDAVLSEIYKDYGQDTVGSWAWKLSEKGTQIAAGPLQHFLEDEEASKPWHEYGS